MVQLTLFRKKEKKTITTHYEEIRKIVDRYIRMGKKLPPSLVRFVTDKMLKGYEETLRGLLTPFGYLLTDVHYLMAGVFVQSVIILVILSILVLLLSSYVSSVLPPFTTVIFFVLPVFGVMLPSLLIRGIIKKVQQIKEEQEEDAYELANNIIAYAYLEDPFKVLEYAASDASHRNKTAAYILSELRKSTHVARYVALISIERSLIAPSAKHLIEILVRATQVGTIDIDSIKEIRNSLAREKERKVLDRIKSVSTMAYMMNLGLILAIVMLMVLSSISGFITVSGGLDPMTMTMLLIVLGMMLPLLNWLVVGKEFENIQKKL